MWQDIPLMVIGFAFTIMLIPQLVDAVNGKALLNFWTCFVTGTGCVLIGVIDFTLVLPFAAIVSISTGIMWYMLLYFSEKNRGGVPVVDGKRIWFHSPPGDTIQDLMAERQMGVNEFAIEMGLSREHTLALLIGDIELTYDMSVKLSNLFGSTPAFWENREKIYREGLRMGIRTSESVEK